MPAFRSWLLIPLGAAVLAAQTPQRPGMILGQVIVRATGDPIAGARVAPFKLDSTTSELPLAITDGGGSFLLNELPPGDYGITVSVDGQSMWFDPDAGFRPGASLDGGSARFVEQSFRRVRVRPGSSTALRIDLARAPIVTGRVVDDAGAAVNQASVCALRQRAIAGRREWDSSSCAKTDAQGRYKLMAYPGTVVISAAVETSFARAHAQGPGPSYTLLRAFAPDSTDIATAPASLLEWDTDQSGVNLTMHRVDTVRVSGAIFGAAPAVARPYGHLSYVDPLLRRIDSFASVSDFDRMRFEFVGVPPGDFTIECGYGFLKDPASSRLMQVRYPVTVGRGNVVNLEVSAEPFVSLNGRMVFDGRGRPEEAASDLGITRLLLVPPDQSALSDVVPASAMIGRDGSFTSVAMPPGRYLATIFGQPNGWRLRSAMVAGRDIADAPIDLLTDLNGAVVTMTNRPADLAGNVVTRTGEPATYAIVLVFPTTRSLWTDFGLGRRLRSQVTSGDGAFSFSELPAGDYFVTAVSNVPDTGWRDEVWLGALASQSTRVKVAEDVVRNVSLVLRTPPAR